MPETANNPIDKVRQLQRRLWVCAKQSRTRRFHALHNRIHRSDALWEACDGDPLREVLDVGSV